jgi:hypothetical protein
MLVFQLISVNVAPASDWVVPVPPPYIPKTGPIPVAKLKPVSEVQLES